MPPSPLDPEPEGTSERRWADYSSAHGGKDGHPFPVDRKTYDRNIVVLTEAVCKARLGQTDKAKVTIATGTVSICCDVDRCRHCPSWR